MTMQSETGQLKKKRIRTIYNINEVHEVGNQMPVPDDLEMPDTGVAASNGDVASPSWQADERAIVVSETPARNTIGTWKVMIETSRTRL